MQPELERLDRLLDAALADPAHVPQFFFAAANLDADNDASQQAALKHINHALSRVALPNDDAGPTPQRIGALAASADGVVQHIGAEAQGWLANALPNGARVGERLCVLDFPPLADAFQLVISGGATSQWRDFSGGRIGFTVPPHAAVSEAKRDLVIILVVATAPFVPAQAEGAIPIATAKLLRLLSPAIAKLPKEWILATPPRKLFKLKDGRDLSFRVYGAASAFPVLMLTSVHTSTLADPFLANGAIKNGLKLIQIGRPGLGASSPMAGVSYDSVADDVAQLVDALDLKKFHIYGSGYASHFAFAAARRLQERTVRIGLHAPRFTSPSKENRTALGRFLFSASTKSWLLDAVAALFYRTRLTTGISRIFSQISSVNARDDEILYGQDILAYETAQARDAFSNGTKAAAAELRLQFSGVLVDIVSIHRPIRAFVGADNTSVSHEDLDSRTACYPNFSVTRFPDTGLQYTQDQANEMMRWLAQGDEPASCPV
jgi:pimeloyl-ACP methyl ester carboxylesterase